MKKYMSIALLMCLFVSLVVSAQEIIVIGQPDVNSTSLAHSAQGLNFPLGIVADASGGVYVADRNNHRVVYFANDGDATADRVYGQHGNFDSYVVNFDGFGGSGSPSAETLNNPTYVALDRAGGLYIADRDNHRVLYYGNDGDTIADRVFGQYGSMTLNVTHNDGTNVISGTGNPSADNLGVYALTLYVDTNNGLYIADSSNHRILYYADDGNTTADRVYGQAGNFSTNAKNNDGSGNAGQPSASSLNFPRGMAQDASGGLYVCDRENHRILYYANDGDTVADRVYGQFGNMTTSVANNDGSGNSGSPSANGLFSPRALAIDGAGGLYVADSNNHRVLYFANDGDTTADWVWGQAGSMTTGVANNDGNGVSGNASATNLNGVQGLALHEGRLYLSDTNNNRILIITVP